LLLLHTAETLFSWLLIAQTTGRGSSQNRTSLRTIPLFSRNGRRSQKVVCRGELRAELKVVSLEELKMVLVTAPTEVLRTE